MLETTFLSGGRFVPVRLKPPESSNYCVEPSVYNERMWTRGVVKVVCWKKKKSCGTPTPLMYKVKKKRRQKWGFLPTGQLWQCNSSADSRFCRCGDQTNADMCFLLLLLAPLSTAGTNITTSTGNLNSHIFTHALLLQSPPIIFSRLSSWSQSGSGGGAQGIREQRDVHVFSLTEENTIRHTFPSYFETPL